LLALANPLARFEIKGPSFQLDRHSHPDAQVFPGHHLEHALWLAPL
jgi:hypothetical protein